MMSSQDDVKAELAGGRRMLTVADSKHTGQEHDNSYLI